MRKSSLQRTEGTEKGQNEKAGSKVDPALEKSPMKDRGACHFQTSSLYEPLFPEAGKSGAG